MRLDGTSSRSYPIKRKPQKTPSTVEGSFEEVVVDAELPPPPARARRETGDPTIGSTANVPARPQDIIFPRSMSSRVAHALASYMATASFVDWDLEVSGLDLHV
ncbi:hypothetical protein [Pseudomonas syringae]|uniref:hypothetical protein n=1 Tax=Pseudomonas syringae TaxID=317 RepID=UPI000CD1F7BE|nr:hypothetical protein [Pseudomonas syringae]MCF4985738.1 hypothetical protein [Pseudomonas syringae]MCF5202029.1 hypothetical protein [Pseudomonas syringae]MCF5270168.1 hypothetical protein [Pseudomonas syringae]MCF5276828.1 hypothetical protein [Pseudomonas syringae]MCF5279398.1 hypothetical protein [Pseudomonas syringae]